MLAVEVLVAMVSGKVASWKVNLMNTFIPGLIQRGLNRVEKSHLCVALRESPWKAPTVERGVVSSYFLLGSDFMMPYRAKSPYTVSVTERFKDTSGGHKSPKLVVMEAECAKILSLALTVPV